MATEFTMKDFTRKDVMNSMTPGQRKFAAMRIVQEAKRIAEEMGISEEAAYELYIKGATHYDIFK